VPDFCAAGGQLENVKFEIVNIDGDVDTKIHHDNQDYQFHMLTIKSDLINAEESIRYLFKQGCCTVPFIRVPEIEGTFCFEVSHSQYTELCLAVKVIYFFFIIVIFWHSYDLYKLEEFVCRFELSKCPMRKMLHNFYPRIRIFFPCRNYHHLIMKII